MHRTLDAKHQPFSSKEVENLVNNGMLVHMLEFSSGDDYFKNTCNALSGNYTGAFSEYRWGTKEEFNFDRENQRLMALATTATMAKNNTNLFTVNSHIGFIVDPSKVEFLAISPNLSHNRMTDIGLTVNNVNKRGDKKFIDATAGTTTTRINDGQFAGRLLIPSKRTDEEQIALKDAFKYLLDKMQTGSWTTTNEIMVNAPLDAVKGILFQPLIGSYTNNTLLNNYNHISFVNTKISPESLMMAILISKAVEQNTGTILPIIERSVHSQTPVLQEIKIEPEKVRNALIRSSGYRKLFEEVLGVEATKGFMRGRADFAKGKK